MRETPGGPHQDLRHGDGKHGWSMQDWPAAPALFVWFKMPPHNFSGIAGISFSEKSYSFRRRKGVFE